MTHHAVGREETTDLILDAADRLIQHYGYCKTTVDDIAREAGIGKGTVYLRFSSKADVALSCIKRINARLQDNLRAVASGKGTPAERLRKMLQVRVMFRYDRTQGFHQSVDEIYAALKPRLLEMREKNHEIEAQIMAEVIVEGRILGEFSGGEALSAARTLVLATNSLLLYNRDPRHTADRRTLEGAVDSVADMLLNGLLARESEDAGDGAKTEIDVGLYI